MSKNPLYSLHPAISYGQTVVENLPDRTGHSIEEWIDRVVAAGLTEEKPAREWLKRTHKLGATTAMLIAKWALADGRHEAEHYLDDAPALVDALYSGKRGVLRPIHDAIIRFARTLGEDVRICPAKTLVPLYRNHVFGQLKPTTQTRIDVGLALKSYDGPLDPARLIETGGLQKGDRITHRIPVYEPADFDDELRNWLSRAYAISKA